MNKSDVALVAVLGAIGSAGGYFGASTHTIKTAEASCSTRSGICSCGICCSGGVCRDCYNSTDEPWWCAGWDGACPPGTDCY
jgi:hypothetical protein